MNTSPNIDLDNKELQNALQLIQFTRRSLFLTGKAGTGKSTFLRYVCQHTKKKHIVLAPTGIAAINAGGCTLHSFFKLPFHPLLPNDSRYSIRNIKETLKYNGEKRKLIREVELIIIDEISMVRADIIDFIDKVLRIYSRNMREPFGGKQLLLVGDIYQLEPVVREEDSHFLRPFYPSAFFFDAHVFREMRSLERFDVSPANPAYTTIGGALFTKDGKILLRYPPACPGDTFEVPPGTEALEQDAFRLAVHLRTVCLPEGLTEINENAFYGCEQLESIRKQ